MLKELVPLAIELSAEEAVGIVFAALGGILILITCIVIGCVCVKVLRQQKVMWRATQVILFSVISKV